MVADGASLAAAMCAGGMTRGGVELRATVGLLALGAASWLFSGRVLRQYDAQNGRGAGSDVALTVVMLGATLLPLTVVLLVSGHSSFHLARATLVWATAVLAFRWALVGHRLARRTGVAEILVLGTGPLGRLTADGIAASNPRRRLLGFARFDDDPARPGRGAPVLGGVDELGGILERFVVDEVMLASTAARHAEKVQAAIDTCERLGVPFALPACAFRLGRARATCGRAAADGYVHYLSVEHKPFQRMMKRLFDIVLSGGALVVLAPLLALTAAAVALTSRGGVLFRQERVGLHGRTFHMLKFRSMVANAEDLKEKLEALNEQSGPVFKIREDPRITPLGRFLRKYSIDELPQLVNVLRGDMSLVGPRPPLPREVARYEAWQRRRLSVRPGLTCVWQIAGRSQISFEDWMLLDMHYIDHWSLVRDLRLILQTVPVVLTGRGAS
jgi:exopolysaccharide biosynthesis polyprenyl glycosylphosphotransferase